MDTESLNITLESGKSDSKSEKSAKVKKFAGKAAQFAGFAGVGAAGTMAANEINRHEDDPKVTNVTPTPGTEETVEETVATPEEFNPIDIMIEDVEEAVVEDSQVESIDTPSSQQQEMVMADGPQPITSEDLHPHEDVAIIDIDNQPVNPEDIVFSEIDEDNVIIDTNEDMYGGPDDWDNFDDPTTLLADNRDIDSNINILDDILNV